ncbi:hypothetical protein [Runella limosa]|uniref:hypothetical protein n=1 Tax=Runella limosa TaxID=370978 RepID=UPI0012F7C028|nr:hypothetical protein [Runella limosa]
MKKFPNFLLNILNQDNGVFEFIQDSTLVPIPSSSLVKPGALRVPFEICNELSKLKDTFQIVDCLERFKSIKSSHSGYTTETRPSINDHFNSLRLRDNFIYTNKIILVDDVITRGTTSISCAQILHNHYPDKTIRVFALLRPDDKMPADAPIYNIERGKITLHPSKNTFIEKY